MRFSSFSVAVLITLFITACSSFPAKKIAQAEGSQYQSFYDYISTQEDLDAQISKAEMLYQMQKNATTDLIRTKQREQQQREALLKILGAPEVKDDD